MMISEAGEHKKFDVTLSGEKCTAISMMELHILSKRNIRGTKRSLTSPLAARIPALWLYLQDWTCERRTWGKEEREDRREARVGKREGGRGGERERERVKHTGILCGQKQTDPLSN